MPPFGQDMEVPAHDGLGLEMRCIRSARCHGVTVWPLAMMETQALGDGSRRGRGGEGEAPARPFSAFQP